MMAKATTTHPLEQFELLPPAFQNERRVRRIRYGWIAMVGALSVILGGTIAATLVRAHRDRRARERLVVAALPLLELRRNVFRLQDVNAQRRQWCQWVESAKPDDNAFQTLAAITATPLGENEIKIDRLSIMLPLEYSVAAKEVPDWATPRLSVSARVASSDAARLWIERLNQSDRIDSAALEVDQASQAGGRVELTAIPQTTRVLP
jgi:hypothetical protein